MLVSVLSFGAFPAYTLAISLGFDRNYGVGSSSLSTVACSDGPNGLLTRNFTTFASIPTFPYLVSTPAVEGWNSVECGSCWVLSYASAAQPDVVNNITVTAIDHADNNYYTSLGALDTLTGGKGEELGLVDVAVTAVEASYCNL